MPCGALRREGPRAAASQPWPRAASRPVAPQGGGGGRPARSEALPRGHAPATQDAAGRRAGEDVRRCRQRAALETHRVQTVHAPNVILHDLVKGPCKGSLHTQGPHADGVTDVPMCSSSLSLAYPPWASVSRFRWRRVPLANCWMGRADRLEHPAQPPKSEHPGAAQKQGDRAHGDPPHEAGGAGQ